MDKQLPILKVSDEQKVWSYASLPDQYMDIAYDQRTKAAAEAVAVFGPEDCAVPELHITGKSLGTWKKLDFTVEWGLDAKLPAFSGMMETHVAILSEPVMDEEKKQASYTCLYSDVSRYGNDSKVTCITDKTDYLGATVLFRELAERPVCVSEAGLFFCPADQEMCAECWAIMPCRQVIGAGITMIMRIIRWVSVLLPMYWSESEMQMLLIIKKRQKIM